MSTEKEKYISETLLKEKPQKPPLKFRLGEKVVGQENIKDGEVTPRKLSIEVETEWLMPILNSKCMIMQKHINDMRRYYSCQIENLKRKLNSITGEPDTDLCVSITPDVFFSKNCADVFISVKSDDVMYDEVCIYVNDKLRIRKHCTKGFDEHIKIKDTSLIKTVAQIMGIRYVDEKVVTKIFPFFVGSGTSWNEVVSVENAQPYKGHLCGAYQAKIGKNNDRLYVIFPKHLDYQVTRIDMNGYEIPMTKQVHDDYMVYESINTYRAGWYDIDITHDCHSNCDCNCDND